MKRSYLFLFLVIAFFAGACTKQNAIQNARPESPISLGDKLYHSSKFRCFECHGMKGEGGIGPSLLDIAKRLSPEKLQEKAHHMCPPSRVCKPSDFRAMVDYLKTL